MRELFLEISREMAGPAFDGESLPRAGMFSIQPRLYNHGGSSSSSTATTTTTETAINEQVGAEAGGYAFGAGATGNTVDISTTDEADLEASLGAAENISNLATEGNVQVTGEALATGEEEQGTALAAGVEGLKSAAAVTQAGLTAATTLGGTAIAAGAQATGQAITSNTEIAEEAMNKSTNDLDSSEALVNELGGAAIAATSNIAGAAIAGQLESNKQANDLVSGAINAIVSGNANSNATLQSTMNSFTAALSATTESGLQVAAGALNQKGQIEGARPSSGSAYGLSSGAAVAGAVGASSGNHTLLIVGGIVAVAALFLFAMRD